MAQPKKRVLKRYHQLVDKRLAKKITGKEKRELSRIERILDKADRPFYQEVVRRASEFDEEVAKLKKLNKRLKKMLARQK